MKKPVLLAALIASACASTQTVLSKPPVAVYSVDQPPAEVAFCLANKNNTPALERADGSRVILIKNGYGGVSMAFTIWPDGNGSRVEHRKQFGTIGTIWKQCVGLKDSNPPGGG